MKETIEILAPGEWALPAGTDCVKYIKGKESARWKCANPLVIYPDDSVCYEVDFTNVPPLYPSPDMEVPEEGIEFKEGGDKLMLVGKYGVALNGACEVLYSWDDVEHDSSNFELISTLPKTIKVCSWCFKEVCECSVNIKVNDSYLISGPNCDSDEGYVYTEAKVLWFDDVFILWGVDGCWPNLNKREQVKIKEVSNAK